MQVSSTRSRRGAILAAALVTLFVVVATSGIMLRSFANGRRQMFKLRQREQIQWIATSAIQREIRNLHANTKYAGESWIVNEESNSTNRSVRVTTTVEPIAEAPGSQRLSVRAEMLNESEAVELTVEKQLIVAIPDRGESL
ncbi:MAG: type II secretory pathway component PulK [Pirellulaceae bacterium]|jgi:type II secretory pathway component PulK